LIFTEILSRKLQNMNCITNFACDVLYSIISVFIGSIFYFMAMIARI